MRLTGHPFYRHSRLDLPAFRYHPDPIATGSVEASDAVCECCDRVRGFVYTGPVYSVEEVGHLCPWCIASGEAHERFDAAFTDATDLDGVPDSVRAEVEERTPGFSGWQQERWLGHHGDACAFLGPAGYPEVEAYGSPDLRASLSRDLGWPEDEFAEYYAGLEREGQPTAYVFRCLHCGTLLGYSDFT